MRKSIFGVGLAAVVLMTACGNDESDQPVFNKEAAWAEYNCDLAMSLSPGATNIAVAVGISAEPHKFSAEDRRWAISLATGGAEPQRCEGKAYDYWLDWETEEKFDSFTREQYVQRMGEDAKYA